VGGSTGHYSCRGGWRTGRHSCSGWVGDRATQLEWVGSTGPHSCRGGWDTGFTAAGVGGGQGDTAGVVGVDRALQLQEWVRDRLHS